MFAELSLTESAVNLKALLCMMMAIMCLLALLSCEESDHDPVTWWCKVRRNEPYSEEADGPTTNQHVSSSAPA